MTSRAKRVRALLLSAVGISVAGAAFAATHPVAHGRVLVRHEHLSVAHVTTRHAVALNGRGVHAAALHGMTHKGAPALRVVTRTSTRKVLVPGANGRMVRVSVKHVTERFYASSFADNITDGDVTDGEDPVVREAAIAALGNMNGTALAIDPSTGRILAMVNQKLALSSGAEPCSTIKLSVALAALQEGIISKDTPVALGGGYHLTLTEALAHSNNLYFETLGRALGFERVKHYANQLGLGELAGL